jgi:uncharacterized protein Usg
MTLYKYVIADRIDILKNGVIRFTQPSALNDPWEMKPHIEQLMTDDLWEKEIRGKALEHYRSVDYIKNASEEAWKRLPRKQRRAMSPKKLESTARAFPHLIESLYSINFNELVDEVVSHQKELLRKIPETIDKTLGLLCLAKESNHRLMWAHYADTFGGFVIEFDETHAFFTTLRSETDELGGLHKITYSPELPSMKAFIDFDEEHLNTIATKMFFTKSIDWIYEQEWRMIKPLAEADKIIENPAGNIHLFTLPSSCMIGLILGHKMNPDKRHELLELVKADERYRHLSLSESLLDQTSYDIEIGPLQKNQD